ncbi:MAG: hypothetical protein IPH84_04175 [Bacteroidales bacterium]|nr:hypothetical protein [Bacteroidales bacterium]
MKRIILLILVCVITAGVNAGEKENLSYIKANGKVYFGYKVRSGLFNTSILNSEGKITKVKNKHVETLVTKGKMYELLPVIMQDKKVECMAMMEYVTAKDGLRLFKYSCYHEYCDFSSGIFRKAQPETIYFVYKDGNFHLRVDANNAATVLPFFGINVIS